jgi:hypothetical protein
MKTIVLLLLGLLVLPCVASAYQVNIEAPDSLAVGKPLIVTGTTTIGIGTPIDVVLYHQLTTTTEIQRKIVYVQSDKTFRTIFDTTDLDPGVYKVEVPSPSNGDSVSMRLVTLFDRTDDIQLTSSLSQAFTGKILVAGSIKGDESSGVQIEVIDPQGLVVFGPQYINTDNAAHFTAEIPISAPGSYEISFTDTSGYIGSKTITSVGQPSAVIVSTPVTTVTTQKSMVSAHAQSSRDSPAYFIVNTGTGPVTLTTSKSIDWIIEYIDDAGILHMENNYGDLNAERAVLQGKGKTIYVKVYPYKYSASGDVFLYGENVKSIIVSTTVPAQFSATGAQEASSQESPLLPFAGIAALGIAILLASRRRG